MERIYFDNAATTPPAPEVVEAMLLALKNDFGNPSSIHAEGRKSRALIEKARKFIANKLNASIGEIFFTSGGTESNNLAIKHSVKNLGVKRIISSRLEHHCGLHSIDAIQKSDNIIVEYVENDAHGKINLEQLESLLKDDSNKTLVSLMHANNEIGTMIDLDAVSALCMQYGAYFHSDTVQTICHYPIDLQKTKLHFLSGAGHKFHGPKGVGFIYINSDIKVDPLIDGGSQERNMRGGTENLYGIVGLEKAFELAYAHMDEWSEHILSLKNYFKEELKKYFDGIVFNGCEENSLYTVLSVSFPENSKSEMLLLNLDIAGISCSGGSACTSGSEKGSHVIEALHQTEKMRTIRFSFSHLNTKNEIDRCINLLKNWCNLK